MGNSHSQHQQILSQQWTHSYPRSRHIQPQVKVLPERLPPLRLRTTDNGAILQNGGTISSRKQSIIHEEREYRPRSSSANRSSKYSEEIILSKSRFGSEPDLRFHLNESRDIYSDNAMRQRMSRSRKKYKAPPAPQIINSGMESSSSDLNGWESNSKDIGSGRKARLFKTRAESNKRHTSNLKRLESGDLEISRSSEALNAQRPKSREERLVLSVNVEKNRNEGEEKKLLKRSSSHEVISPRRNLATPEFQAELLEAAQRLRPLGATERHSPTERRRNITKRHSSLHTNENFVSGSNNEILNENEIKHKNKNYSNYDHDQALNKMRCENFSEDRFEKYQNCQFEDKKEKSERDVPSKKFYFGMEGNNNDVTKVNNYFGANNVDKTNAEHRITAVEKSKNLMNLYKSTAESNNDWEDCIDRFAATFHKPHIATPNGNTTSCSSSFVSDPDEDVDGGIALQLRPTLPKKQLEIPRFSPTAAWRLLSSISTNGDARAPSGEMNENLLLLDRRIHPPASQQMLRSNHDKSGDSGISGDASPGGCPESSYEIAVTSAKAATTPNSKNILMTWTPQQDLEEETSSDDLESPVNSPKNAVSNIPGAKFSPRGQLFLPRDHSFSMSLPREDKICLYPDSSEQKEKGGIDPAFRLNSLQKLKVALGSSKRHHDSDEHHHSQNDNWVLSRSVPSSLNNSHIAIARSISNPSSPEQDDEYSQQTSLKYPSYSYLTNGGRMMYLPEYHSRMSPDVSGKKHKTYMHGGFLSKSCENIMQIEVTQLERSRSPSPIICQSGDETRLSVGGGRSNQKKKKFTFQSTVRLLENRRIAEKLAREAELKENQRLSEVEAMKKVEEEFQKKRAREKASIRHQLRLFNLEGKDYSSLPPDEWEDSRNNNSDSAATSLTKCNIQAPQASDLRKVSSRNRKTSTSSDSNKFPSSTQVLSEFWESVREYRDYRHPRYTELQSLPLENNRRSVVEHPRVVYDMPKSTAVYVSAPPNSYAQNMCKEENRNGLSTPRSSSSDNYRKDFAHGALVTGGRSFTSSDSELSQSHARSHSPQGIIPRKLSTLHRSRSASPDTISRSESPPKIFDAFMTPPRSRSTNLLKPPKSEKRRALTPTKIKNKDTRNLNTTSSTQKISCKAMGNVEIKFSNHGDYHSTFNSHKGLTIIKNVETPGPLPKSPADGIMHLGLSSVQPFNKTEKSYRPINFTPTINKLAQTVN